MIKSITTATIALAIVLAITIAVVIVHIIAMTVTVTISIVIALTAAATFSILDTYIPSMGESARSGAGFGIGANLVGFPRV